MCLLCHFRSHKPVPVVSAPTSDAFRDVKDMLHTCQDQEHELTQRIEVGRDAFFHTFVQGTHCTGKSGKMDKKKSLSGKTQ